MLIYMVIITANFVRAAKNCRCFKFYRYSSLAHFQAGCFLFDRFGYKEQ